MTIPRVLQLTPGETLPQQRHFQERSRFSCIAISWHSVSHFLSSFLVVSLESAFCGGFFAWFIVNSANKAAQASRGLRCGYSDTGE